MISYILIEIEGVGLAYQEVSQGAVVRYVNTDGNYLFTAVPTGLGSLVVDRIPPVLAWMVAQPEQPPITTAAPDHLYIDTRTLIDLTGLVMADQILSAMEQAAAVMPVLNRILKLLEPSQGGIDVHNPQTRGMIDQLEAGGVFTAEQAAALRAL